jgi:glycosyltransferase involved in cell wall biosynthesis
VPEISVVVPTRDVGKYVGAVLGDLRAQTFVDFEAIVVDDGSTDQTQDVIATFLESDQRFRLLSSGGTGAGAARNLGVDQATGEFLAFVDGDDRLSLEFLRKLHESAVATGSDLVSANAQRLAPPGDFRCRRVAFLGAAQLGLERPAAPSEFVPLGCWLNGTRSAPRWLVHR